MAINHTKMKKLIVYMAFAFIAATTAASAQTEQITLEDIWTKRTFASRGIGGIRSMQDGEHYLSMTRTGIAKYSYLTGEKVDDICLFGGPGAGLKAKPLPPMESYAMSTDEQKILLSSGFEPIYRHSGVSDYYIYDVNEKTFTKISNNGKQRLTTLSPDGTKVAFVRDNNLYWMDLATLEEHAITTEGKLNAIICGTTDWVYEEEFAITQGFQWSPDSKKIAYMVFDESKVKEYNMQMWGALYPEDYRYKYPKAGEDNSKVELRVYDVENQKALIMPALASEGKTNATWEYIPRFQWADAGALAFMRMNRLQNHMQILGVNVQAPNKVQTLYEEQDAAYVEVPDTWQFITVGKGKNVKEQMLITSERDGYRHIYLYGMDGKLVRQVTSGEWEVCDVPGVDAKNQRLYYTSREDGSTNKSLFVIGFDGNKKQRLNQQMSIQEAVDASYPYFYPIQSGASKQVYKAGTYNATFSNGCKYYIQTWSDANHAPVYTLHDAKGKLVKTLQDNAELQQKMADYGTGHKKIFSFPASNGTSLNCYTITPADFDSTKPITCDHDGEKFVFNSTEE